MVRKLAVVLGPLLAMAQAAMAQTLVQTASSHGAMSCTNNVCTWTISKAITAGNTIVGFIHAADSADQTPVFPQRVTDNAGNTYTLSPYVQWTFPEDIGLWTLTNVQGSPTTFTFDFSQYTSVIVNFSDNGLAEYSCTGGCSLTTSGPIAPTGNPVSISISPTAPALIWALAADFGGSASSLQNSGYSLIIDDLSTDDIGVWGSNALVPAGPLTLTWTNASPPGADCDGIPTGGNGCNVPLMAVAVSAALLPGVPAFPPSLLALPR